jgi:uroporphyrinogen decarboxylase
MTSRQRVRAVLNKEIPDKIPNGLGSCETGGTHILTYEKLKRIFDVQQSTTRLDTCMINAVFEQDMLKKMSGDIILLGSPSLNKTKDFWTDKNLSKWKKATIWDTEILMSSSENDLVKDDKGGVYWGENYCPKGSYYFDPIPSKFRNIFDFDEYPKSKDYNPNKNLDERMLIDLERNAQYLFENTEYSISCGETITDLQVMPCAQEVWWSMLVEEPEEVKEFLGKACEAGMSQLKQLDQAIGKYTDILCIAHDLGDSRCVTMGPKLFRDIYKPYYKEFFGKWKQTTNMKSNFHSCGAISEILPDLIECGIDILNPVQISAFDMSPENITRIANNEIIFFGGSLDSIFTIDKNYDEVYNIVKHNLDTFKTNGNYIFAGVHNLTAEIPESSLRAMFDAYFDIMYYK